MILQGATISYYFHFIDILIDILFNIVYCSTLKLGSKCVHNQVTIRLSTHVFDHFAACTSFELETWIDSSD